MKTRSAMQADISALIEELGVMQEKCVRENRDPIDAERAKSRDLIAEIENLEDLISLQNQTEAVVDRVNEPVERKTVMGSSELKARQEQKKKDSFLSFGEQLAAIMQAGVPGGQIDPRLRVQAAATGLSESVPADGGFLVQQDFTSELLRNVMDTGLLASRCKRITISNNANSIKLNGIDETSRVAGSRWGGIRGYWLEEAGEKTASKPKFRKIELNLHKLIGLCYATDELLEDASALEGIIRQGFQDEFGFLIDDAIINGSGAGQPLGIMNGGSMVSVAKETSQTAGTIVYENIVKMWARVFAKSRPNAAWLINQDCEPYLHTMALSVGTGGAPVYLPAGGASASPYSTLYGRPVLPIEQAQTCGTTGDIILADLTGGYILAEKGGMQSDMSIHVRFVYDESVFRFVVRIDGQPVLASALTPYKGTDTLSHFVKLDTRA